MNNKEFKSRAEFRYELEKLINKHSQEQYSNTPDFILANYLNSCLLAFEYAIKQRNRFKDEEQIISRINYMRR